MGALMPGGNVATGAEELTDSIESGERVLERRVTWFIAGVLACGWIYAALVSSSAGYVAGGYDSDGYLDAAGNHSDTPPLGINVSASPSAGLLIFVAILAIAALAIARARRSRPRAAVAVLDRAQIAIALVTVISAVAVSWWVGARAVSSWDGTDSYTGWTPGWLAAITIEIAEQP